MNINKLKAMVAAGATAEMIVAVVEVYAKEKEEKKRAKRLKDAARQRRRRHAESRGVTRTSRDIPADAQDLVVDPSEETQEGVVLQFSSAGQTPEKKEKKESSPHTPLKKEKKENKQPPARARDSKTHATRLPDDWQPDLDDLAFAKSLLRQDLVAVEIGKFRDYWHARAGPKALSVRWSATWRNWIRREAERPLAGGSNGNGTYRNGSGNGTTQRTGPGALALLATGRLKPNF